MMRIKEKLVRLTGDVVTAVILDLYMGWSYWSLWVGDPEIPVCATQGWVERPLSELKDDVKIPGISESAIQQRLEWLVLNGFLDARPGSAPEICQYRANVYVVKRGLFAIGCVEEPEYPPLWWEE